MRLNMLSDLLLERDRELLPCHVIVGEERVSDRIWDFVAKEESVRDWMLGEQHSIHSDNQMTPGLKRCLNTAISL